MIGFMKWLFVELSGGPPTSLDQTQSQGFCSRQKPLPTFYKEHFKILWKSLFLCPKAPESEILQLEAAWSSLIH